MESAIISGKSKNMKLIIALANKMGIKVAFLSDEDTEAFLLANAIREGKTGEFVDTNEFLASLK